MTLDHGIAADVRAAVGALTPLGVDRLSALVAADSI